MTHNSKYFYGNEISEYGLKNKRVDYKTLAKAFEAVLNNNIIENTSNIGYWEAENDIYFEDNDGNYYTPEEAEEKIEELEARKEELEELEEDHAEEIQEIESNIEALEDEKFKDIYQYYIVSDNAVEILREAHETIFYNDVLDMYVWGVDHWGTSWDYVLTDIKLDI